MTVWLAVESNRAWFDLGVDAIRADDLRDSRYVYIEGYLVSSETALEAALEAKSLAREASVPIAVTLSDPSMVTIFRDGFDAILEGGVDLLFCNQEEAAIYTGETSTEQAAAALTRIANRFVITLGAEGSMVFDGEDLFKVPTPPANAIDTNGAGDLFAGAFLFAANAEIITDHHGKNCTKINAIMTVAAKFINFVFIN